MKRRNFLRAITALPFVPAALKGDWAVAAEDEETPRCEPPPVDHNHRIIPHDSMVAADVRLGTEKDPEVMVVVPPGRLLHVHGSATMTGKAALDVLEDGVVVAQQRQESPGVHQMDVEVYLAPTPGAHVYRLIVGGTHTSSLIWADLA